MTKTFTFAIVHFSVALTVAYIISGSWIVGGAIALVEPLINSVAYHFHEMAWSKVKGNKPISSGMSCDHNHNWGSLLKAGKIA